MTTDIIKRLLKISSRSPSLLGNLMEKFAVTIERFLSALSESKSCKHSLCKHRYNCVIYALLGFIQRFVVGFGLQAAFKVLSSLLKIIKSPKLLIKLLKSPVNRELGMFLGTYVFIYRAFSCLYRWLTNTNNDLSGLISGFFAGWSMIYYKSSSLALYFNFKLLEVSLLKFIFYRAQTLHKYYINTLYKLG